ncbi:hypothetical protein [Lactobacillus acetotolerans]|uniref:hypothetical protein n=1 Tax=Lactobacillus acetotolerans TaxID=1600 RepID=UPI001451D1D2|nr:hypothetical protein [Lactobacillus acetotolerans]QJD73272.1 hypothetical protein HG715_04810 [Lactobacillus acetotolerans]
MSFMGIVGFVLLAVVILSVLFALFHIFFALLPVAIVAILIIWLIYRFTGKGGNDNTPTSGGYYDWFSNENDPNTRPPRKKARNVKTKDVDK